MLPFEKSSSGRDCIGMAKLLKDEANDIDMSVTGVDDLDASLSTAERWLSAPSLSTGTDGASICFRDPPMRMESRDVARNCVEDDACSFSGFDGRATRLVFFMPEVGGICLMLSHTAERCGDILFCAPMDIQNDHAWWSDGKWNNMTR